MPSFASERITIAVVTAEHHSKVFQLGFQRKDGSLSVSFPYYRDAYGLLCHATLKAGTPSQTQLNLTEGGKFTTNKVKYSHHPDGNVLFSQDGKIYSRVRKKSVPLSTASGHLFTVQIQGLGDYDAVAPGDAQPAANARRTRINFNVEGPTPEAFKFVGHWYSETALLARMHGEGFSPWTHLQRPDGSFVTGAIIRDPFLKHSEPCYLLLTCETIPRLDQDQPSALTFMGGFDPPQIAFDHSRDTSFLALSYPTSSYETLGGIIGTVDYVG